MSFLADLNKKSFDFPQKYRSWPFLTTSVHYQNQFSHHAGKVSTKPYTICQSKLLGTLCQVLKFLSFLACEGLAVVRFDIFRILAFNLDGNLCVSLLQLVMLVVMAFSNPPIVKFLIASNAIDFYLLFFD